MNENLDNKVTILPPFKRFCMTIGELPTSYLESMTYYESLVWLCNYLQKTVIPTINANGEAVIELQEKYIELKDYVDNYFENLDVQEEINNKLDDMAEKGELATIIALYLQMGSILAYDTKSALKGAENIADGTTCKTLGESNYNDGKGNFYKIRELVEGDVIDDDLLVELTNYPTLVAEKLPDYRMNQVEGSITTLNDTTIPTINNNINLINSEITVCIGDSYAEGVGATDYLGGWSSRLKTIMGLSDNEFYNFYEGGAGLVQQGGYGHTFLELLQENISSITDLSLVKNVIICGGYNDYNKTTNDINLAINNLIAYIKEQMPNAKIYFGMIARSSARTEEGFNRRLFYTTHLLRCYQNCSNHGAIYLNGVENILHQSMFMYSDNIHPNNDGYNWLAGGIYQALISGSTVYCGVGNSESTITDPGSGKISNTEDLIITAHIKGDFTQISVKNANLNFKSGTTISSGNNFYIGTLTNPQFIPNPNILIPVPFYITTAQGKFYEGIGFINFDYTGNIAFRLNILKQDGSTYFSLGDVTGISIITGNSITLDNIYC